MQKFGDGSFFFFFWPLLPGWISDRFGGLMDFRPNFFTCQPEYGIHRKRNSVIARQSVRTSASETQRPVHSTHALRQRQRGEIHVIIPLILVLALLKIFFHLPLVPEWHNVSLHSRGRIFFPDHRWSHSRGNFHGCYRLPLQVRRCAMASVGTVPSRPAPGQDGMG